MEDHEYFAPWEWQPIEFIPSGCKDIIVRDNDGNTREICSCDYWWFTEDQKELYTTFRFE